MGLQLLHCGQTWDTVSPSTVLEKAQLSRFGEIVFPFFREWVSARYLPLVSTVLWLIFISGWNLLVEDLLSVLYSYHLAKVIQAGVEMMVWLSW